MPLETGDFICDLIETNPPGTDPVSQGDDHLRLIKHVLKTTFPNVCGVVSATDEELSNAGKALMPIVTTYTTPVAGQTHNFTAGRGWYRIIITGGGGGGNGNDQGGGAGGTCIKVAAVPAGGTGTYTLGGGGAVNGGTGSDSTWSDGVETLTARGGTITEGGTASGGDINIQGGGETGESTGKSGGSYWAGGNNQIIPPTQAWGTGGRGTTGGTGVEGSQGIIVIEEY
jgi:hypothetical protein